MACPYWGSASGRFGNDIKINQLNLVLSVYWRTGIFFFLFLLFVLVALVSPTSLQYNGIINYNDKQIAMPIICVSVRSDMWSVQPKA